MWSKGDYIVAGGPPFMLAKGASVIHDEVACEVIANFPSLEAAVMYVELNYEEPERDRLTMAILMNAVKLLKGVL